MSRRFFSLALPGFLIILFINWSCTKLDTTNIGSDLIPAVDNIKTFADTLDITTTQGAFDGPIFGDSTKLSVSNTAENYAIGKMTDPISTFGNTDATLFFQLKPSFYPYYIGNPLDTLLTKDSVVLCLSFNGVYGDTSQPIFLQVNEVPLSVHGEWDSLGTYDNPSLRTINYTPGMGAALSAPTLVNLAAVRSYKKIGKGTDSVINQIRIKLDNSFRDLLFEQDSLPGVGFPHGFARDTYWRNFVNNGFAITMTSGNALLYTHINDTNTRLEMHYTFKHGNGTDTSMTVMHFNNGAGGTASPDRGAVADHIVRTRPGLPTGDQEIFLQSSPGTFATLHIPELAGYSNRIIHRAEIIMQQIPDNPINDGYFSEPNYLYLDLVDTGATNRWKPIYFDLNPSVAYNPDSKTAAFDYYPFNGEVDFSYFGGIAKTRNDAAGIRKYYTINISRYVQQLVTKQTHSYDFRLFAPHDFYYPQYEAKPTRIPYVNNIAQGRVRFAGGSYSNPDYRMRLRIIYSQLN